VKEPLYRIDDATILLDAESHAEGRLFLQSVREQLEVFRNWEEEIGRGETSERRWKFSSVPVATRTFDWTSTQRTSLPVPSRLSLRARQHRRL